MFILYLLEALTVVATGVYAVRSMLSEDRETIYVEREYLASQLAAERQRTSELIGMVEDSRGKLFEHNCKIFDLIQFSKPPTEEEEPEEDEFEDEPEFEEDYIERKGVREKKIIHQTQADHVQPGSRYE